jgi:hypothetical protein
VELRANASGDISKITEDIASMQTEIEKNKSSTVALYESYKEGKLTKEMYMEEKNRSEDGMTSLLGRMEKLKLELEALRGEPHENQFVDSFKSLIQLLELTPQLISELVEGIKIHAVEDIAVTWNFEDDYQRVLLHLTNREETI